MTMDIKNFYLNTPVKRYEYLCLKWDDIPENFWEEYKLKEMVTDDIEVHKGMYGLLQVGLLVQELLTTR